MEKRILITFLVLLTVNASGAGLSFSLEEPVEEWTCILSHLRGASTIRSHFEETRTNPFHRHPVRFEGTIRWQEAIGLSLQYRSPSDVTICMAGENLLMRRDGKISRIESTESQTGILALVTKLFAWDINWIKALFDSSGKLDENGQWTLELIPTDESMRDSFTKLVLNGQTATLDSLFLDLKGGRTVLIRLSEQIRNVQFSSAELKSAFLTADE